MKYINFQIVDILSDDISFKIQKKWEKRFTITLYGINDKNERIVCHILKFLPYFYLKVPNTWDTKKSESLIKSICDKKQNILNSIKSNCSMGPLNLCSELT